MKRFVKLSMAVVFSFATTSVVYSGSIWADGIERTWNSPDADRTPKPSGLLNSFLPSKKPASPPNPRPAVPAKAAVNFTTKKGQPIVPVTQKTKIPTVAIQTVKVRKKRKKKTPTVAVAQKLPAKKANSSEAVWWETIGNPVVFAFRDCSVKFARQEIASGRPASAPDMITGAMRSSCQVEFAKMAGVLIGGLGEKQSNAMLTELAKTTFLPSVAATLTAARNTQITQAVKITEEEEKLSTAKSAMFRCFSERTDRLTIARNTQANTIADAVLIGCQNKSDVFFDLLFANSKASRQVKLQQKNIALNETYKIAIIRRVLATRKPSQVKTATQQ